MIRTLAKDSFRLTRRTPALWLLALLAGETGLIPVLIPPQTLSTPHLGLPSPHFDISFILGLFVLLAAFWLFSALAIAALILTTARTARAQSITHPWGAARAYFWPMLGLRALYLLALALLLFLLSFFAALPLVWLAVALAGAALGLSLNFVSRALILEAQPRAALAFLLTRRRWGLFKAWIGSQLLSLLILLGFLLLVLSLEIIALVLLYFFSHAPDPYFTLLLLASGLFVALPLVAFIAFAGAFINTYWTCAYLRLRSD
jgi:hypothetical protein